MEISTNILIHFGKQFLQVFDQNINTSFDGNYGIQISFIKYFLSNSVLWITHHAFSHEKSWLFSNLLFCCNKGKSRQTHTDPNSRQYFFPLTDLPRSVSCTYRCKCPAE